METIEKNGISYVTAHEIGRYYKLAKKRTWIELQKAQLTYIILLHTHLYNASEAKQYFDNLGEYDGRVLKSKKYKEGLV